jgi:arylformamidase
MQLSIDISGKSHSINTNDGVDLSIPIRRNGNTLNAYYLSDPKIEPVRVEGFTGSVQEGGPVNCEDVFFNPHGNGTHTECVGHISNERMSIIESLSEYFFLSQLITLSPEKKGDDLVLDLGAIEGRIQQGVKALIIRTLPNSTDKVSKRYSGNNPAYITAKFATYLADQGIEHLLIDLPSVDKEEDGGALVAHRAFWNYPAAPRVNCTITELIYAPDTVSDGIYLLNLMLGGFDSDAAPSKPIIYPLESAE